MNEFRNCNSSLEAVICKTPCGYNRDEDLRRYGAQFCSILVGRMCHCTVLAGASCLPSHLSTVNGLDQRLHCHNLLLSEKTNFGPVGTAVGGDCFWNVSNFSQSEAAVSGRAPRRVLLTFARRLTSMRDAGCRWLFPTAVQGPHQAQGPIVGNSPVEDTKG